ncbi:MAG: S-layer homology domain-containing protein [Oscillospiraceae bacterium]
MTFTCKHQGQAARPTPCPSPRQSMTARPPLWRPLCACYTLYECKHCEYSYIADLVQPHGHSYDAVVTAPTADEGGYTTHTCVHCGHSYVDELTEALGHKCAAFTDIAGHWAKDAICFVTEQGLFQGVTNTTFAPRKEDGSGHGGYRALPSGWVSCRDRRNYIPGCGPGGLLL